MLLGTKGGPAIRPGGPWPTSSLLELGGRTIVVDCGLGVTRGIVDAGLSLKALDLDLRHASAFRPCAGARAAAAHRLDGRAGDAGRGLGPAGTARLLAAFPAVDGIRHRDPHRRRRPARPARPRFDFGIFGRAGSRRRRPDRVARCASTIRRSPIVTRCASSMADAASCSRPTRPISRRSPISRSGADILVHEAMLEEGIERLVARTGNGARLKEHLLASHTHGRRCRPHCRRGRGRASRASII